VANIAKKSPKNNPHKETRVIDYAFHTTSKAKDDGFSNTGMDINKVPQSEHRVESEHLPY